MKRFKLIASILTIASLLLSAWSIYELTSDNGNIVTASLNLTYFITLFIALLCVRISMGVSQKLEPIIVLISLAVISLSTYTWLDSTELLVLGKYTLGLLPILIGTTLMLLVKSTSKWSKLAQLIIGLITISLSVCVFTGAFGTSIYSILFIGMILLTGVVMGFSLFAKAT